MNHGLGLEKVAERDLSPFPSISGHLVAAERRLGILYDEGRPLCDTLLNQRIRPPSREVTSTFFLRASAQGPLQVDC